MENRNVDKARDAREPEPDPNTASVPGEERRCLVCGNRMVREIKEGVSVHVCDPHGIWLDKDQLPRIIEHIRERGHEIRRIVMQRTYEEGRKTGAWWGFWF